MHQNLPKKNIQEAKLLERAIDAFRAATGLPIEAEPQPQHQNRRAEALIRLRTPDIDEEFAVELKMHVKKPPWVR